MEREKSMPEGDKEVGAGEGVRPLDEAQKAKISRVHGPEAAAAINATLGGVGGERATTRQGQEIPQGWTAFEIMGPQQYPIEVVWPKERSAAEKHIKDTLALVEISKSDLTQQTQIDLQNAQAVLETLEIKKNDFVTGRELSPEEFKEQKEWAKNMRYEIKARLAFHAAFNAYENKGSIKDVSGAALSLAPDWYDVIFGLQEEVSGAENREKKSFNPFVEALQYYEDHGHEFARANSEGGRGKFGEKVQQYLALQRACLELGINVEEIPVVAGSFENYIKNLDAKTKEDVKENKISEAQLFANFQENALKEQDKKFREFLKSKEPEGVHYDYDELVNKHYTTKEYEWASNMAERLFRFTGRGIMYDYLVINRGKLNERTVGIDYDGPEKPTWAGGRDGCDYPMSKIMRFREFLRAESGLLRSQIELLDGVDIYGGDFWSRTVKLNAPDGFLNVSPVRARISPDFIDRQGRYLYQDREPQGEFTKERTSEEKEKAKESRRLNDDNYGERVGHLNFRLLGKKDNKGEPKKETFSFIPMGAQVMSLWASRFLDGPEEGRKALSGSAESFLLNPTFDSLSKLLNAFEYSKAESWETKKHLLLNFIKYARGERGGRGKRRLSENEILAGVNKLTGLTDENAPQFIQPQERTSILKDYFYIKLSPNEEMDIKNESEGMRRRVEFEIKSTIPNINGDELEAEIKARIKQERERLTAKKLASKIERKANINFVSSAVGWFSLGALQAGLKQFFAELGIK